MATALVIGGGRGIGAATVDALAATFGAGDDKAQRRVIGIKLIDIAGANLVRAAKFIARIHAKRYKKISGR